MPDAAHQPTSPQEPRNGKRSTGWRIVLLVALIVVAGGFVWWQWFETYHFVVVDPGKLYRDGNRSVREFRTALRKSNPRTVVAVIDEQEYNQPEFVEARKIVQDRGLDYVWIKIRAGGYPTPEQVRQFLEIARDPARQPVLYHDDEGIRRAGMLMAAYQESVLGYDNERTKASIRAFGHGDRTINEVREFIDAYDPVAGLTRDMNPPTTAPAESVSASATGR